ncbi:MAG TPA: polyamine ABC transporter substrate-binding protein [Magnetospirillaceae bacterium]|jgi:putative spermidine/putrescine transport system substrate-binding protein
MSIRPFLLAGLVAALPMTAMADDVVLSTYGLAQPEYRANLYTPFESQCGCKMVVDTGNSSARLAKLEAHKDNPDTDIAALSDASAAQAAKEGLIEPIDVGALTNYAKIYPFAQNPIGGHYGIGYTFYSSSVVYRSDKLKGFASWKDLWSPELKGKLALPDITTTQGVPVIYMINRTFGGSMPDMKTGIDKIGSLKDSVTTFYPSSAVVAELFQQEEIWAAPVGRFDWPNLKKLNVPLAWAKPSEGQSGGMNVLVLIKGAKHKAQAMKFLDFWLSTQVQTAMAMAKIDSPANAEVKVPADVADVLVYGKEAVDSMHLVPPDVVLTNRPAWVASWNATVAH